MNKFNLSAVALALFAISDLSFAASAQLVTQTSPIVDKTEFVKTNNLQSTLYGVQAYLTKKANSDATTEFTGTDILISVSSDKNTQIVSGIYSYIANSTGAGDFTYTLLFGKETAPINSLNINSSATASGATGCGILLTGKDGGYNGTQLVINSHSLNISTEAAGYAYGIYVGNTTTDLKDKIPVAAIVNADHIVINVSSTRDDPEAKDYSSTGIATFSQGVVKIQGNLEINAEAALMARGNSTITINEGSDNYTTKLYGDIDFDYHETTGVDSLVSVNLTGSDSIWRGNKSVTWTDSKNGKPSNDTLNVERFILSLSNGATWTPTVVSAETNSTETSGRQVDPINVLNNNNGRIDMTGVDSVEIEVLNGTGGELYKTAESKFVVTNSSEGVQTVTYSNVNSDDVVNGVDEIVGRVEGVEAVHLFQEGDVVGSKTVSVNKDGQITSIKEAKNTVNASLIDIASSNYLFFRSQINDISARMGDLRSMPKTAGAWVRYYGGQNKYSDRGQKEKYNTIQIGGDAFINDNFYLGGTFSYTDGDGTLRNGSTDDKNYNFGIYGGWIGGAGQFVDVIIKRHRVETDFDLYNTNGLSSGSYHNWGTTASVEAGWRLQCPNTGFYAEPQVELQFGRLDSVNYRTSKGVKVEQDGIDSIIGRAGVAVGYTFPENKGTAYAKASVLHDWKGEVKSTFSANGVERTYKDDLGGTWGEFAVGATYNPTKNVSAYTQVKTSTGSPVRNPWQVSVGLRYSF